MKKSKIKFIALTLILTLVMSISSVYADSYTADKNTNGYASVEEARNAAIALILGNIETTDNSNWKSGVRISNSRALFDLNEETSAYLFELTNKNEKDSGYIIVSASKSENPIIEYSCEGNVFLDTAIKTTQETAEKKHSGKRVKGDKTKLYYLGGITYLAKHQLDDNSKEVYDISTIDCRNINIDEVKNTKKTEIDENEKNQNITLWNDMGRDHLKGTTGGSTPPDSGFTYITDPSKYESGYSSSTSKNCTSYYQSYYITSIFAGASNCAPTAATNLCVYWYNRDKTKYAKLYDSSKGWKGTYDRFYTLMGTKSTGTSDANIANAYISYFKEKGVSAYVSALVDGTNSGKSIVSIINNYNAPVHLMLHGHYLYGDHSVIALGYNQYAYKGTLFTSYSTYIRIADGWTNYPTRFVWGGCKGSWKYVSIVL